MSDYSRIKQTPEYKAARHEVEVLIEQKLGPLYDAVKLLKEKVAALERKSK
ncbi:MAG TPA: hypothetical protein VHX86_16865 [Tepidisphaeraceae bacterium]|jgi:hypothetical protein|nr:hypothetical protein [Tepidisphaeraceae bacterium]